VPDDRKGMDVLQSDGISLKGFVDLFKLLKGEHGDIGRLKLPSTHPLTEERLRVAEAMVEAQKGVGKRGGIGEKVAGDC